MPYGEARAWALRASGGRAGRQREEHTQRPWGANRSGVLGAEWQHGVQVREEGGSGQGAGPQCSSEDSQRLVEGAERVIKESQSSRH